VIDPAALRRTAPHARARSAWHRLFRLDSERFDASPGLVPDAHLACRQRRLGDAPVPSCKNRPSTRCVRRVSAGASGASCRSCRAPHSKPISNIEHRARL
jgi:hypothetical protein